MHVSQLEWFVILGVTMAVLLFDVVFSARRLREPTKRECAIYVGLAVLFGLWVWFFPRRAVRAGILRGLAHGVGQRR